MEQKDLVKSFTVVEAFRIGVDRPCQDCAEHIKGLEAFATDTLGYRPFTNEVLILDTSQDQPVACLTKLEDQIK